MKIALVHDYLTQRGGAERVFELLCNYFPQADIFTSVYDPDNTIDLGSRRVNTTFVQHLPAAAKYFRLFAPLYYSAFRALDLQDYDLVISSTSSFAKAVRTKPSAKHICLCHNVTRFLWDTQTYLQQYSNYKKYNFLIEKIFDFMRRSDLKYSQEPDVYVANSSTVAKRIEQYYGTKSLMVNYPIDSNKFCYCDSKDDFYLVACRLFGYKKVNVIIEAFNQLQLPLSIIGDGPERKNLEAQAKENIQFLGYVSDRERQELMAKARTVIVAALEDYGLVPVEANASGTPVISYGAGGVLDTQISGKTGVFFNSQTAEDLKEAVLEAKDIKWDSYEIRNHAISNFSEVVFFEKITKIIESVCDRSIKEFIDPDWLQKVETKTKGSFN